MYTIQQQIPLIRAAYDLATHEFPAPFPFEDAIAFLRAIGHRVGEDPATATKPWYERRFNIDDGGFGVAVGYDSTPAMLVQQAKNAARAYIWRTIPTLCDAVEAAARIPNPLP